MIVTRIHAVETDLCAYAWHRLRLFSNPEFTTEYLIALHEVPHKHRKNVTAQAQQIRYCLVQAQEYFDAAAAASLATKPLVLYYALMSFALAEVLLKSTGDERLAKLRENHAAHGLTLVIDGSIDRLQPLAGVLSRIRSVPQFRNAGQAYGTFEVWRRQTREAPIPVAHVVHYPDGTFTQGFRTGFASRDEPPPDSPKAGYSLARAISALPQLRQVLANAGITAPCVRAKLEHSTSEPSQEGTLSLLVHPHDPILLQAFYETLRFEPNAVNVMEVRELPQGVRLSVPIKAGQAAASWSLPPAVTLDSRVSFFATHAWALGEFGSYYCALHALGNLVRYFPDLWMPHVERSSAFALLVQETCEWAVQRLPVLVAGELDRTYYFAR